MQNNSTFKNEDDGDDGISVRDLIVPLWRSRWLIVSVAILMGILNLSWSLLHASYNSYGVFQFGGPIPMVREKLREQDKDKDKDKEPGTGIALADYKRYMTSYSTSERFADFAREKKLEATPDVAGLRAAFASRDGIAKLVLPIYPYTKLDAKDFVEQPKNSGNNVIGLRISYDSASPEQAKQMVGLLGQYVMDSIVYMVYSDILRFKPDEIRAKVTKLENTILNNKTVLEELKQRAEALRQIVSSNPAAASQSQRQVVNVTEETARYLPPTTQLMTAEVQAAETRQLIEKTRRALRQESLFLEYYEQAKKVLDSTKSGETVVRSLDVVKDRVFKGKNLDDDMVKEIYNFISIENQQAVNLYFGKSRFIAGPILPVRSTARPLFSVAVGLMLGLLLSALFVLARQQFRRVES